MCGVASRVANVWRCVTCCKCVALCHVLQMCGVVSRVANVWGCVTRCKCVGLHHAWKTCGVDKLQCKPETGA
eukprot:355927-Chlamydomonas_euryale.AAC.2